MADQRTNGGSEKAFWIRVGYWLYFAGLATIALTTGVHGDGVGFAFLVAAGLGAVITSCLLEDNRAISPRVLYLLLLLAGAGLIILYGTIGK